MLQRQRLAINWFTDTDKQQVRIWCQKCGAEKILAFNEFDGVTVWTFSHKCSERKLKIVLQKSQLN
jgi:hypothetical protein